MSNSKSSCHISVMLALCCWATGAQGDNSLDSSTTAELLTIINRPGEGPREVFVPAVHVHEGAEVFYTVRVRNTGSAPTLPVVITKAIPRNTRYVPGSAAGPGADIDFSIDGGRTFDSPERLTVRSKSGRNERLAVDSYTHIRWQLRYPLAPGAVALLRFRVIFK